MASSPSMTFNAVGNVRASSSLAAATTTNYGVDFSAVIEGQVTVAVTLGGTVAATHGVRFDAQSGYGAGPSYTVEAAATVSVAQATVASGSDSATLYLPTGKYQLAVTNLDSANAVTVSITSATVDSYS